MQVFTSEDLQRRPAEVQQSALMEPAMITFHGRPRLVILSVDEYERLQGRRHLVLEAAELPEEVLEEMRKIAEEYPVDDADLGLIGGLVDDESTDGTAKVKPR